METAIGKEIIEFVVILFVSHLFADFIFQTDKSVAAKSKTKIFLIHISIAAILPYLFCGIWTAWYIPLTIGVSHALIDSVKLYFERKSGSKTLRAFLLDQSAHISVILILGILMQRAGDTDPYWFELLGRGFIDVLILLGGLILVVKVSGLIIGLLVKPLLSNGAESNEESQAENINEYHGISGGGEIIGQLERLLIFFFVLAGVWEAIGFLVAAKSIFRFGELKDKENRIQAEYILIGTLYSFSFGLIFSWLTSYTLTYI